VGLKDIEVMKPTRPMEGKSRLKTWGEKLHREEKVVVDQLRLIK